ncbi:hypothetical protein EVAR_26983_1 [Eumeta japonica]|uniref:Uncharacterized protein n=1 Tax=Eumeta variegata TaxID=151549 RepID=A0A4C1VLL5_EUMVA|nr:hypothetical protein EVAR_26983_1 [Eumeta japonica]
MSMGGYNYLVPDGPKAHLSLINVIKNDLSEFTARPYLRYSGGPTSVRINKSHLKCAFHLESLRVEIARQLQCFAIENNINTSRSHLTALRWRMIRVRFINTDARYFDLMLPEGCRQPYLPLRSSSLIPTLDVDSEARFVKDTEKWLNLA